jgi:hypothetical protein
MLSAVIISLFKSPIRIAIAYRDYLALRATNGADADVNASVGEHLCIAPLHIRSVSDIASPARTLSRR